MLTSIALIFLCGLFLGRLFRKLKLPSLLGMIITGMILSTYGLNLLDDSILNIAADLRQAAIGAVPLSMGLACGQKVLTVAVLSILITAPFGAICIDRLYQRLLGKEE